MACSSIQHQDPRVIRTRDLKKCRRFMEDIQRDGQPVAIDTEGVNLGADGRMTLLQICTWDGCVYLLDLIDPRDPDNAEYGERLLYEGGVQAMLESRVEKVTHACSCDSAALFHQFGIRLHASYTFDTQAADATLQCLEEGTVFPQRRSLSHLANIYETPQHPLKGDHATWMDDDSTAWERRPLSRDMIDYACYDVTILIPDLYNELRRRLDQNDGWETYRQMVDWNICWGIDKESVLNEMALFQKSGIKRLFRQMQKKYTADTDVSCLSYDEKNALKLLQKNKEYWGMYSNKTVRALEETTHLDYIERLEDEVREDPRSKVQEYKINKLYALGKHPNLTISEAAQSLRDEIKENKKKYAARRKDKPRRRRYAK